MTRVLITGAAGQLGQALLRILPEGMEAIPVGHRNGSGIALTCDISRESDVMTLVTAQKPEVIINCAALTDVDGNEEHPDLARRVNTDGVAYLLGAAAKVGARLVQVSTDYVFNGAAGPYLEGDPVNPISVYGRTKLEAENMVLSEGRHLVVRGNVLFGPGLEAPASFVRWVVESLQAGKTIRVVTDQINNPTLTTHLAEALITAIRKDGAGLYHYGSLDFLTRYEFAQRIADYFKLNQGYIDPISTADLHQKAPRPLKSGLICSRMKMDFDVLNHSLDETFQQAFEKV